MKDNTNTKTAPSTPEIKYSEKSKFIEPGLVRFEGVSRFKSIARAIRKGYVTPDGQVAPKRPFNNRKDKSKSGHSYNALRKQIYNELISRGV